MSKTFQATFAYEDTDFTRTYNFEVDDATEAASLKAGVLAVNASLRAGTAGGLSSFFVSNEGDNFTLISDAQLVSTTKTTLAIHQASSLQANDSVKEG